MYGTFLFLHILGATIWTGGHLVLALSVLPAAIKNKDVDYIARFEKGYEKIGLPALVVQVLTGLHLAYGLLPDVSHWFDPEQPFAKAIFLKLILLLLMIGLALHARLRVLPNLDERRLKALAWHIIPVTLISVLFVLVGVSFRTGWLY